MRKHVTRLYIAGMEVNEAVHSNTKHNNKSKKEFVYAAYTFMYIYTKVHIYDYTKSGQLDSAHIYTATGLPPSARI